MPWKCGLECAHTASSGDNVGPVTFTDVWESQLQKALVSCWTGQVFFLHRRAEWRQKMSKQVSLTLCFWCIRLNIHLAIQISHISVYASIISLKRTFETPNIWKNLIKILHFHNMSFMVIFDISQLSCTGSHSDNYANCLSLLISSLMIGALLDSAYVLTRNQLRIPPVASVAVGCCPAFSCMWWGVP